MPCRICGADISGKCYNCGEKAPIGKHYCLKCFKLQEEVWNNRITNAAIANGPPGLLENAKKVYGSAKMIIDDIVPPEKSICVKCGKKPFSFF